MHGQNPHAEEEEEDLFEFEEAGSKDMSSPPKLLIDSDLVRNMLFTC